MVRYLRRLHSVSGRVLRACSACNLQRASSKWVWLSARSGSGTSGRLERLLRAYACPGVRILSTSLPAFGCYPE